MDVSGVAVIGFCVARTPTPPPTQVARTVPPHRLFLQVPTCFSSGLEFFQRALRLHYEEACGERGSVAPVLGVQSIKMLGLGILFHMKGSPQDWDSPLDGNIFGIMFVW